MSTDEPAAPAPPNETPFLQPLESETPDARAGGIRRKLRVAGWAVAAVGVLALAGLLLLRPKPPASNLGGGGVATGAPASALTRANAPTGPQTLIGGWEVGKVAWDPQAAQAFSGAPLGELWAAKVRANQTKGAFNLDDAGNAETVVEIDDAGFVTVQGDGYLFKSDDGATAVVSEARRGPGVALGGIAGETGFLLTSGAARQPWTGEPADFAWGPLKDLMGNWRSPNWPARGGVSQRASLVIGPDGRYNLKLVQVVKGAVRAAADGTWSETPLDPTTGAEDTPVTGTFRFNGPNEVVVTAAGQGQTTWERGQ